MNFNNQKSKEGKRQIAEKQISKSEVAKRRTYMPSIM